MAYNTLDTMPPDCVQDVTARRISQARRLWLFLDYDGTLADFAPTPDHVFPDAEVVDLVIRLAQLPGVRVAVVSGRRLAHVRKLIPVPGVLLAGTYGVELQLPDGQRVDRAHFDQVRPILDSVKPQWAQLIDDRPGYFLEDKGWSLALHARSADDSDADTVLTRGRDIAEQAAQKAEPGLFRILGGHKFLELGPALGHKGRTVEYLLDTYPWSDALILYLGDDDKDEEAFGVVQARNGIAIVVSEQPKPTQADCRLRRPQETRLWLTQLADGRMQAG